jgi:hypothetical protein
MATSGSNDFTQNRLDIITEAMELLGVLGEGEVPNSAQITTAARTLNMMVKHWQNRGHNLQATQRVIVFLEKDKQRYSFGVDNPSTESDRCCLEDDFIPTTLTADAAALATVLQVGDTTGMAAADEIGIETTGGTLFWTTIVSVDSSTQVTITTGLDAAASSGNNVYTFTTRVSRWRKVLNALVITSENVEVPVEVIERQDYADLSIKDAVGRINQVFYLPTWKISNLFVWTTTDDETDYLKLWVQRPIEDVDSDTDDMDLPQEWYLAISQNLAIYLAPKFGTSEKRYSMIKVEANQSLLDAESDDGEERLYITPDDRRTYPGYGWGY